MDRFHTEGMYFVDEYGRQRIFNGINLCDKGMADEGDARRHYDVNFSEELIKGLSEKGFNLVRLGLTWDAVEPEKGQFDEEYLDRIEKVADYCEKYGVYFYLDMHQDLYSGRPGTSGDGAPYWACLSEGGEFKKEKIVWAEGYFWGKATQKSFDNFWQNKNIDGVPIQDYYCRMWQHIAERFKDHPALFGFDVMNEPFPGTDGGKVFRKLIFSVAKNVIGDKRCNIPELAGKVLNGNIIGCLEPFNDYSLFRKVTGAADKIIREFDTKFYSEFINRTAAAIRKVTDNGIIMMENSYYSNLGIPYSCPVVNYNGVREKNVCFAPHAYDLMVDTPAYKYASNTRVGGIFDEHRKSQQRLDVPVIVGEWGGQSEGTDWLYHIRYLLDKFDGYQWGQTYWCYYDGLLDNPIMTCLVRTAPIAVCGKIDRYSYDRTNNVFTLEYTQDRAYKTDTEIYLHDEPKTVECSGEYEIMDKILHVKAGKGNNKITIKF